MNESVEPLKFRHRIGWLALAVLPLVLLGLGAMGGGIHLKLSGQPDARTAAPYVLLAFGFVTALIGMALILGSWDIVIDKAGGTVTSRVGTLGLGRTRITPVGEIRHVVVVQGRAVSETVRYTRYKVYLHAGGERLVYLTEFTDHDKAAAVARDVARYLGVPDRDLTAEPPPPSANPPG